MPRVKHVKKSQKAQGNCGVCRTAIEVGMPYKWFKKPYQGKRRFCTSCRIPASSLSGAKYAVIHDSIHDAEATIGSCDEASEITSAIETVVEEAREIAEEYRESRENMPEGLQDSPVGEQCEEYADEIEGWCDEVENFDVDEHIEGDSDEEFDGSDDDPGEFDEDEPLADDEISNDHAEWCERRDAHEEEREEARTHWESDDAVAERQPDLDDARNAAIDVLGDFPL